MPARQCNATPESKPIQPVFDPPTRPSSDPRALLWSRFAARKRDVLITPDQGGDQGRGVQS